MLSHIFRNLVQNGMRNSSKCSTYFKGQFLDKLKLTSVQHSQSKCLVQQQHYSSISLLLSQNNKSIVPVALIQRNLNKNIPTIVPMRTVIKYSMSRGKRRTVGAVIKRFYRLNWGIWIRPRAGRTKRLWTKRHSRIRRLRTHVFCNSTQSYMLDKMVTRYYRKPKYWVDDPYTPYHSREEYWKTRTTPLP